MYFWKYYPLLNYITLYAHQTITFHDNFNIVYDNEKHNILHYASMAQLNLQSTFQTVYEFWLLNAINMMVFSIIVYMLVLHMYT